MRRFLSVCIGRRLRSHIVIGCVTLTALTLVQGSLAVPEAFATSAPTATTGAAQQVQFASATVTGTVNPLGSATTYYFQYGTTASYGLATSATSAGAGTAAVAVQQGLNGLAASTIYHYRVVAVNAGGTVTGADATFTTSKPPAPVVSTLSATSVTATTAVVNATVNPEAFATTYDFQYGTTAAYGHNTTTRSAGSGTAAVAVSEPLSGLAASTAYHYRVVAVNAGGTVVGGDATFTTSKTPPPLPTTLAATNVAYATAVVAATVNPEGFAATYDFQYGTTAAYGHITTTRSVGSGTTAVAVSEPLSGLAASTTYHYRIAAVNAGGTVVGRDMTFTTTRKPAPSATTGAASAVSTTTVTLAGSVNPHAIATTYYFQYGTKSPTVRTPVASAGAGIATIAVSASLTGLVPGTTYLYRLVAVGATTVTGATRSFTTAKIPPGLSLTSRANPIAAGASATFDGKVSGTGVGVRLVALQIEPYPYHAGFVQVGAAVFSNAAGGVSFTLLKLAANTMVRAVTVGGSPSLVSAVIVERAVVQVSVHVHRHGRSARFSGLIGPAGAPVQIRIQRRFRGHWVTIVRTSTHPVSGGRAAYAYTIRRPHRGRYRVVAHVRDSSLLSGRSTVVMVH
jgi:phosphodiesterase/alkaline phosphatase D-like protein